MPFEPAITLTQSLLEPSLFGGVFAAPSFWTWRTLAKIVDGTPLVEPREVELFAQCTGRTRLPSAANGPRLRRFIILAGRRAGKDRFLSAVAVWRAALCADWRRHLSPGEQAVVILLGKDKKQASILANYCRGLLRVPALAQQVVRQTQAITEFRNGSLLEIANNDASLVRGRSAVAILGSECCHWKHDEHSSSNDEEVISAGEPSMSLTPDGGITCLGSSVHRQRGYMFRKFRELWGNDDSDTDLCWFAPSKVMNPRLPQSVVDAALANDPHRGSAEFENRWREDLSDFVPLDAVEGCTDFRTWERAPLPGLQYLAYTDAATGTGSDSFTLCIAHRQPDSTGTVVVDLIRERTPRFVPADVIREYSQLLKLFGVYEVVGDAFGGGLVSDEWQRHGISFKPADFSTSENYLRSLPILLAQRCRLLDNARLRQQLTSLERSVAGSRETVSHPRIASAHDDVATAVCGALVLAGTGYTYDSTFAAWQPDFQDRDVAPTAAPQPTAAQAASAVASDYVAAFCRAHGLVV
jgi:hypothetical protein